jgi:hypothetical protein
MRTTSQTLDTRSKFSSDCVSFDKLTMSASDRLSTATVGQPSTSSTQPNPSAGTRGQARVVVFKAGAVLRQRT